MPLVCPRGSAVTSKKAEEKVEFSLWDQEVRSREMYHESTGNLDYDTISDRSRAYWRGLAKESLLNSGIKVEEKGSTMTDFKVGDKVTSDDHAGYGHATVLGYSETDPGTVNIRFDSWKYDDCYGDSEYPDSIDYHQGRIESLKLVRTLAEKRADDRKVLEEASDRWSHSVQSPSHYKFPGGGQVIDITRHLPFLHGNIVKYVCRAGRKGSEVEDLLKARKYLDWAIEDAQKESN